MTTEQSEDLKKRYLRLRAAQAKKANIGMNIVITEDVVQRVNLELEHQDANSELELARENWRNAMMLVKPGDRVT